MLKNQLTKLKSMAKKENNQLPKLLMIYKLMVLVEKIIDDLYIAGR